jgi:uncharacterized protein
MPHHSALRSIRRPHLLTALALGIVGSLVATTALIAQDSSPTVLIGAVQGSGDTSPMVGREVSVEGVVTAVIDSETDATAALPSDDGWFVQGDSDGDPTTSDALFVIDSGGPPVGQRVRVRGTVVERDSGKGGTRTALEPSAVAPLGNGRLPTPQAIAAPPTDWERYEHMRVRITGPLTVAGTHRVRREGELMASFGGRLATPTEIAAPGATAQAVAAENARRTLRLDDRSDAQSPAAVWYLPKGLPRTGSRLSRVEGVVDQRGGGYRLQLTAVPTIAAAPRPRAPKVGGDLRIVGFNLENMFNGDGRGGGFPTPRGARSLAEYQGQLDRHLATIRALKPDILALMELENDGYGPESSIAALVAAMRKAGLGEDWRFVDAGTGSGSDEIRVALLYRAGRVAPVGSPATLTDGPFAQYSRAPLAQSFRAVGSTPAAQTAPAFTIAVNHFKSKGCNSPTGPGTGADADLRDGQSCWNATRSDSARRVSAWLRGDPTRSGSDLAMIIGDLNAYGMEDPVRMLIADGWRDAYASTGGEAPYSYVYDGQTGRLDHALLSPSLAQRLAGAAKWHTNADEPERSDSTSDAAIRGPAGPWRSSDHDPLLLGFRLSR